MQYLFFSFLSSSLFLFFFSSSFSPPSFSFFVFQMPSLSPASFPPRALPVRWGYSGWPGLVATVEVPIPSASHSLCFWHECARLSRPGRFNVSCQFPALHWSSALPTLWSNQSRQLHQLGRCCSMQHAACCVLQVAACSCSCCMGVWRGGEGESTHYHLDPHLVLPGFLLSAAPVAVG